MSSLPNPPDQLEAAADQAIAACGGDTREAVKALIIANHLLEKEKLRTSVSTGYARAAARSEGLVRLTQVAIPKIRDNDRQGCSAQDNRPTDEVNRVLLQRRWREVALSIVPLIT